MVFSGCSSSGDKVNLEEEIRQRFDKGMVYLGKKRYLRAQEEFNYVVISGSHTELGDDAQFYLAEAYFLNEEYVQAIAEFDQLIRKMPFTPFLETARYRICTCYVSESLPYYHDQTYTEKALDKLQEFLDDYPNSEHQDDANDLIEKLREKRAKKLYETALLYIKMDEFTSAILAFEVIVERFYDTPFIGQAHVGIIRCHSLKKDKEAAEAYFANVEPRLQSLDLDEEARRWLEMESEGKEQQDRE